MTPDQALELAFDHFQAGRFADAGRLCQQIMAACPTDHRAVRLLGAVCLKTGQLPQAEQCFRHAIQLAPGQCEYHDNLCTTLNALQKWADLESVARQWLGLSPGDVRAENCLGLALRSLGWLDESEAAFRRALQRDPQSIQTLNNLSGTLRMLNRAREAESVCRQALALAPDVAASWLNLGAALHAQQQEDAAIQAFDVALERDPGMALAAFNKGTVLDSLDRFTAAERSYRQALRLQPDLLTALNNLGSSLKSQGRLDEAIECFRTALRKQPDYMVAHTNLLLSLQCHPGTTPQELLAEHRDWNRRHAAPLQPAFASNDPARPAATGQQPLRVGFVSPDLGGHPVGRFLIAAFERFDSDSIATVCYSDRRFPDAITERFRRAATVWHDTQSWSDEQLARQIRSDGIDLLIDLTGHTAQHRLRVFARRPAPVQASWIGYAGTTGLDAIDWIIASDAVIPPQAEAWYSERVARLPHRHICIEPPGDGPDPVPPPCLVQSVVTFGSFNKLDKTTDRVLATWSRILHAVPGSRLVLRNRGLDDPDIACRYRAFFKSHDIAADRVGLHGWSSYHDLMSAWNDIDIALDTFPFSGGATSVDALWMSVPVVTLAGPLYAGRQTTALLTAVDCPELITTSEDEYVEAAVTLAGDPERLTLYRSTLRGRFRNSPLCRADEFARDLQTLFFEISDRH